MTTETRPDQQPEPQSDAAAESGTDNEVLADGTAADDRPEETDAERIARLTEDLEQLRERHARAAADYQNLQRRSQEARLEQVRRATASAVMLYLPVLDDLKLAVQSVDGEIAEHQWVEGIRMVQRKFENVLEAGGVSEIEAEGAQFDPTVHEAVGYAPGPEGRVVALLQNGYQIGEYVVRAARVMVGDGSIPDGNVSPAEEP